MPAAAPSIGTTTAAAATPKKRIKKTPKTEEKPRLWNFFCRIQLNFGLFCICTQFELDKHVQSFALVSPKYSFEQTSLHFGRQNIGSSIVPKQKRPLRTGISHLILLMPRNNMFHYTVYRGRRLKPTLSRSAAQSAGTETK